MGARGGKGDIALGGVAAWEGVGDVLWELLGELLGVEGAVDEPVLKAPE